MSRRIPTTSTLAASSSTMMRKGWLSLVGFHTLIQISLKFGINLIFPSFFLQGRGGVLPYLVLVVKFSMMI